MKRLLYLVIVALVLQACSNTKQFLQAGNYDAAVRSASHILSGNRNRQKEILYLEEAFKAANQRDLDRIKQLKLEGNPANTEAIYQLYEVIRQRQETVKPLLPLFIKKQFRNAQIDLVDIDAQLADAKNNASEFLYASAIKLLQSSNKADVRTAYDKLYELSLLNPDYKDSRQKMNEAFDRGKVWVNVTFLNSTGISVPVDFSNGMTKVNTATLNGNWVYFEQTNDNTADFTLQAHVLRMDVTPERQSDNSYTDQQTIQDGWKYEYDKRGNVKKDSSGNDIKLPRMVDVFATVYETKQSKRSLVAGEFLYMKGTTVLQTVPFSEEVLFENYFATYKGDDRALSKESKKKIGGTYMPFPHDMKMLIDNAVQMRQKLEANLAQNRNWFLQ